MKKIIKFTVKALFCYALCGGLYLLLEMGWKKHTALSMFYLAGFVSIPTLLLNDIFTYEMDFLLQCGICTVIATIGEGIVGHIVNMDYKIWNYTSLPLTFWDGQINLFFCCIWFLLFLIFIPILDYIEWKLFDYKPHITPYYRFLGKKRFDLNDILSLLKE